MEDIFEGLGAKYPASDHAVITSPGHGNTVAAGVTKLAEEQEADYETENKGL